ncbi:MAG: PAS domain S-box protein [Oceanococcus sp.]
MAQSKLEISGADIQAKYDALLSAAVDAIVVIDENGIMSEFSPAASRLFGYARSEALGQNVSMLMPEPYHSAHDHYLQNYQESGAAKVIGIGREVVGQRKNGETFPMDLAVGEIHNTGAHGFVGLIRDISARKAVEEKLRQRESELTLTVSQAPMAIATTNLDGDFLTVNQAFCNLVGHAEAVLRKMNFKDVTHPDDIEASSAHLQQLASGSVDRYQLSKRYVAKSGRLIHGELHNALVRDDQGRPLFMIAEIVDRTTEVQAAQELAEHRESLAQVARLGTLGEVAAGIAHEINQPLAAVSNYAMAAHRLLSTDEFDKSLVLETLLKISKQAEHAGDVIGQLRRLLKRRLPVVESVNCNASIEEISSLLELDLRRHALNLKLHLDQQLPAVDVDPVQLQQVLINLVHNGMDAMSATRNSDDVTLSTVRRGRDWIEIHVDDTGCGIPESMSSKLFDPFVSTKTNGLGLGLSICKSIVDAHGGELRHSPRASGGTRFTLLLPVSR